MQPVIVGAGCSKHEATATCAHVHARVYTLVYAHIHAHVYGHACAHVRTQVSKHAFCRCSWTCPLSISSFHPDVCRTCRRAPSFTCPFACPSSHGGCICAIGTHTKNNDYQSTSQAICSYTCRETCPCTCIPAHYKIHVCSHMSVHMSLHRPENVP